VASVSDGNGAVRVARQPVVGVSRVARFMAAVTETFWTGVAVDWATTNGQPTAVLSRDGIVFAGLTVTASAAGIDQLLWFMNPNKMAGLSAVV
jgi:hypothetical protein